MRAPVFFRPAGARVGDTVPWVADGRLLVLYQHEPVARPGADVSWRLAVSDDVVVFAEQDDAFAGSGLDDPELRTNAASIVRGDDGVQHLFSTATRRAPLSGPAAPQIVAAVSRDDLRSWQRAALAFGATEGYEAEQWRDPFVFHDDEAGLWRMLIAARHLDGAERRRGVIAQCVSTDLMSWTPAEPFWDPRRYVAHERPEVFRWGAWWYLVYAEFSDSFVTRYRMARELGGPWLVPDHDTIDGRGFGAARSIEWEGRRLFVGRIAAREGGRDDGAWQRSGAMSVIEARQNPDGTLAFGVPDELTAVFDALVPLEFRDADTGADVPETAEGYALDAPDGYSAVVTRELLPTRFSFTVRLSLDVGTTECGVLLRASEDAEAGYIVRLEPRRDRMVLDRWSRRDAGEAPQRMPGDVAFALELERPCDLSSGEHLLDVIVEDDICVVSLDRAVTLSTRMYDIPAGRLGLFVGEGGVTFSDLKVHTRPGD